MIALVGPPGSGKTTVGAALATRLGTGFRDLDAEVAARFGDIADIVLAEGAVALAAREAEVLGDLVREPGVGVIAVGSAALDDGTAAAALAGVTVVYLDADLAHSFPRSGMNTPQPRGLVNPRQLWARMLRERDTVYRGAADHVVAVGDLEVDGVVEAVAGVLPPVR